MKKTKDRLAINVCANSSQTIKLPGTLLKLKINVVFKQGGAVSCLSKSSKCLFFFSFILCLLYLFRSLIKVSFFFSFKELGLFIFYFDYYFFVFEDLFSFSVK